MNVLSIIEEHTKKYNEVPSILVSGSDQFTKEGMTRRWIDIVHQSKEPHVVIDMSKMCTFKNILDNSGVTIGETIPGSNSFSVFDGDQITSEDRLRVCMESSGWDENNKDKAIAYIKLLQHIHDIEYGEPGEINLELISMYSAPKAVEYRIQQLVNNGILNCDEQINILGRYSELSTVAPNIENILISYSSMFGITKENKVDLSNMTNDKVLYVYIGKIKDMRSRKNMLESVSEIITDYVKYTGTKPYVTIYSKGNKYDSVLAEFLQDISEVSRILLITENLFAIENYSDISQCFQMRIYSRHNTMEACEEVEKCFGNIYVRKKSYSKARDMHFRARGIFDRIMGTDVVLTETTSTLVAEAKYRKEDISMMPEGYCIVSYAGENFMTAV